MKKFLFAFIAMTTMTMEAQNITDALRYSTEDLNGTARYRAMSGAFGALGGDLSSLNVNPAGSAVFLRSFSSLSLDFRRKENDVTYFNGFNNSSNSNVGLGQAGAVFVFNSRDDSNDWRKFTVGFNYSTTKDFETDYIAHGRNTNSIDQYFLGYADGLPLDLLVPYDNQTVADHYSLLGQSEGFGAQQAFLGYESFLIEAEDPDDWNNTSYYSNIGEGTFNQEYAYAATGLNGKFAFNFATQFQDNLYLGLNLNSHFLNYEKTTRLYETNNNPGSLVNEVYFEDHVNTLGSGFSFDLGAIAKLGNRFRVGASYESPTWYTISEESTQYLDTYGPDIDAVVDPNVVNIFPDYKLQSPGKYTGSLAVLFGTQGLLSFDYSYKDYGATKFKPTSDPDFSYQNELIQNRLQGSSTYRIGGEYRISRVSLRGGYRFEESPYQDATTIGDLTGYSLGAGYDFGNLRLDLAYDTAEQERNQQLYQVGLTDAANISKYYSNVTLTLSFGI